MLIALVTFLFLGGGGSTALLDFIAEANDSVEMVVPDGERQDAALDILEAIEDRTGERIKVVEDLAKEVDDLVNDVDASSADFDAVWEKFYAEVESHNSDVLDLRYQLREQLTRDEWQQVFPPPE